MNERQRRVDVFATGRWNSGERKTDERAERKAQGGKTPGTGEGRDWLLTHRRKDRPGKTI